MSNSGTADTCCTSILQDLQSGNGMSKENYAGMPYAVADHNDVPPSGAPGQGRPPIIQPQPSPTCALFWPFNFVRASPSLHGLVHCQACWPILIEHTAPCLVPGSTWSHDLHLQCMIFGRSSSALGPLGMSILSGHQSEATRLIILIL